MNNILIELEKWGCDLEGVRARFLGDDELYENCLSILAEDPAFEGLGKALKEGDVKQAFESAHTLKGVIANMGLTEMYGTIVKIVEPLRNGKLEDDMTQLYEELISERAHLRHLIKKA